MGAKVQFKSYIPLHNGIRNKNEHSSSSLSWYYKDNLSDHLNDGSLLREANGYSQCDKEMLKRMMLEHEATFTLQVCELHRLYRIQKDLMNELKYREQKHCSIFQTNIFASHMLSEVSEEFRQMPHLSVFGGHSTTGNAVELPLKHYNESNTQNFQIKIKTAGSSVVECDFLKPKTISLPRKKFDLHLPAEIYIDIDDEIISAKQKKPCLRVANLSSITHSADGNNNVKLSHRNKADENINGSLRPGMHPENVSSKMALVDLNEPLKLSSYDEGEVLTSFEDIGSTTEHEEVMGHHLQSERSFLSRDFFLGCHGQNPTVFTGSVNTEWGDCSQGWLSPANACGEFKGIANCSDKGLCDGEFSIITPSAKLEPKKYDQFILPDQNKSDKCIEEILSPGPETSKCTSKLPNLNRSELDTTQLPHPLPNAPHSDIFSISSLLWRISNGVQNLSTSVINSMKADARPRNESNQSDDAQYVDVHSKELFKNDSTFCQTGFQKDVSQSLESSSWFRKNLGQCESSNIEESAFQIESLKPDTNALASSVNKKILKFPIPEMCGVNFRNHVKMHSSASSMITGEYLEGKAVTEAEKDIAYEEKIKEFNYNLTNVSITLNKEADPHQRDGSHEAAENLITMSFLIGNHSHDHTRPLTPTSSDTLYWFADFAASTELSTEISREKSPVYDNDEDVGFDMFEFLTLKLKEIKDEFVCKPQENQNHDDSLASSPLLTRSRRGLARKRRQRRDFQKDILPGIASLSRHEVTEDLQSFESIMRALSKSWKSVSSRSTKWKQKNCRARRRRRTGSLPFTVAEISIGLSPKQEISTAGILGWGRTTRRCQRQKVLPGILSVPLI